MAAARLTIITVLFCLFASPAVSGQFLAFRAMGDDTPQAGTEVKPEEKPEEKPYKKKKVFLAFLLSTFIPSSGQFYNGEYEKGAVQASLIVGGLVIHKMSNDDGDKSSLGDPGLVIVVIAWAWSMFDAPMSAHRINEEHRIAAENPSAGLPARGWDAYGAVSPEFDSGRAGVQLRF